MKHFNRIGFYAAMRNKNWFENKCSDANLFSIHPPFVGHSLSALLAAGTATGRELTVCENNLMRMGSVQHYYTFLALYA